MTGEPKILFFMNTLISWSSLIVTLGGLVLCLSHQRSSPKMWLVSLGFAGLLLGALWYRLGIPLFTQGGSPIVAMLLIGGLIHLISWSLLVCGLAGIFSDLRHRLPRKD